MNNPKRDSEKIIISEGCYEKTKVGCDDKIHMSVAILHSTELQILNG